MEYLLVSDDCTSCHYVINTFTLLRLPLKVLTIDDFHAKSAAQVSGIIVCSHLETAHKDHVYQVVRDSETSLISFHEQHKITDFPIFHLHASFSQHELNNTLLQCASLKKDLLHEKNLQHPAFEKLVGNSEKIRELKSMIYQVAESDTTVLILGQSGCGKDVVASCIHHLSKRHEHSFVPINCGAIPGELMESELFGHEKGAFTGASTRRPGRFEMADGGTLFLDEIGDMPMPMQVKLLRVIQDRRIERVGGNAAIDVDVRLIAATNKQLEDLIEQHLFREDLYYRLNVFPIQVPSLHERAEDIPALIDYHSEKIYERMKHRVIFSEAAREALCQYRWPGNIRELQNFLERMVILHPDQVVDKKDLPLPKQKKAKAAENTL